MTQTLTKDTPTHPAFTNDPSFLHNNLMQQMETAPNDLLHHTLVMNLGQMTDPFEQYRACLESFVFFESKDPQTKNITNIFEMAVHRASHELTQRPFDLFQIIWGALGNTSRVQCIKNICGGCMARASAPLDRKADNIIKTIGVIREHKAPLSQDIIIHAQHLTADAFALANDNKGGLARGFYKMQAKTFPKEVLRNPF